MTDRTSVAILPWFGAAILLIALSAEAGTAADKPRDQLTTPELWQEYYGWRQAKEPDKAHAVAQRLLELAAASHGEESLEYGKALAEVGITEVLLEKPAALDHLDRAESILKEHLPIYSEELIVPFTFLGSALQSAGRHRDAMRAFTRGQHITHRLWGTSNQAQLRVLYAKAESAQALGDIDQAEQLQRAAYKLVRQHYPAASVEHIEAAAYLGTWLRSVGDYHGSISHFHAALSEVQGDGPDLPEAYPLLQGMAHAYRGGYRGRYARTMHQRVVDLMAAHPDWFTLDQRMHAHLDYGDWLMQRYFEGDAIEQYQSGWQLASESGPAGRVWLDHLSRPQLVRYGEMTPRDLDGSNRYMTFRFDLTDDGRPRRVRAQDHGADTRETHEARRAFPDKVRYRPAIVDGRAVALRAQEITMYVLPEDVLLEPTPVAAPGRLTEQTSSPLPIASATLDLVDGEK